MRPMRQALTPHPQTPCDAVTSLEVEVERAGELLRLRYRLEGELSRLAIPPPAAPVRADELWRHTCFEAFVKPAGSAAYVEYNFAPALSWAAYAFDGYRDGMREADAAPAELDMRHEAGVCELTAAIPAPSAGASLALTAVIEETSGRIAYWSLAHPPGRPDFHHPASFVLELP